MSPTSIPSGPDEPDPDPERSDEPDPDPERSDEPSGKAAGSWGAVGGASSTHMDRPARARGARAVGGAGSTHMDR
jgi:hypothetical protein